MKKIEIAKCEVGWEQLCKMELHDVIEIYAGETQDTEAAVTVMRVPGGWIYTFDYVLSNESVAISSNFVPYSENYDNVAFLRPPEIAK